MLAACLLLSGCASGDHDTIVIDSAGVQLVTNHEVGEGWRESPRWTVTQDLAIAGDSAAEYQFGRIGDLAVAPNGNIAVIDQLNFVVRVFDRAGTFVRSFGRQGRGPGELSRSANGIYFLGDSLLVLDPGEQRMTVFTPDGSIDTVIALPQGPRAQGWFRLENGDFLMRGLTISRVQGKFTFWDALLRVRADGASSDTLFEFDYAKSDLGGGGPALKIPLIVNNPTWARLSDGRIAWTALDRDFVQIRDSTGSVVARIRHTQWQSREVTPADRTAMVELLRVKLRAIGGDASFADSPQVEAPRIFPAITAVRAGPEGTIWVQLMGPVESIDPMAINAPDRADFLGGSTWHVLDSTGEFMGAIEFPPRFRPFRITDDAIYGAARDDDGVERILRLRLQKGS